MALSIQPSLLTPMDFTDTRSLHVSVTNNNSTQSQATTLNTNSAFSPVSCNVPAISPHSSINLYLQVSLRPGTTIYNIPNQFHLVLGSTSSVWTNKLYQYIGAFRKFGKPGDSPYWNVWIMGVPGSTKSSFINTLSTLFQSGDDIVQRAPAGSSGGHYTTEIKRYRLFYNNDINSANIALWDTWGLSSASFSSIQVDQFIDGVHPDGYSMNDAGAGSILDQTNRDQRKAHSVIFFFPYNSFNVQSDVNVLTQVFKRFRKHNPVVVISLVDNQIPNARANVATISQNAVAVEAVRRMVTLTGLPELNIFTLVNYKDETARNFEIERIAFKILHRAMLNRRQEN